MSWIAHALRALLLFVFAMAGIRAGASEIPGLAGGNRAWVAMLIEDHGGMREIVWDGAFTDLNAAGPFKKDHRYAILTKGSAGLVDLGCWDEAWPSGSGWTCPGVMMAVKLTSDGSGALLTSGGKSTWLPVAAPYTGKGLPAATLRGAYLNWLLAHRGATPSVPRETRWQRLQRGAEVVVRDLLTRSGGQPEFRVVGIGTSGRLLIPPGEGLSAGLNAVARMEPSDSGCMLGALKRALETVQNLKATHACAPGIVLPMGDGWTVHRTFGEGGDRDDDRDEDREGRRHKTCGTGDSHDHSHNVNKDGHDDDDDDDDDGHTPHTTCGTGGIYESSREYAAMLATVRAIRDTGQAAVWAWSVDGVRTWAKDFAFHGAGQSFAGDAVATLDASIKTWLSGQAQPLKLTLTFDQPGLTRVAQVTLSVRSNHGLVSATLNGQPLATTGLETRVPLTLKEGINAFEVSAADSCGSQAQASASITLDTTPPAIVLDPAPPALTNQAAVLLQGRVDDPSAALTLNGQPLPLDPQGGFTTTAPLVEGHNVFAFLATDPAGNTGRLDIQVVRDTEAPLVVFTTPLEGFLTNAATLAVSGTVSDPSAAFTVNGTPVQLTPQGGFSLTLTPPEGPLTLLGQATDAAGNVGRGERRGVIDRTPPLITLDPAPPALVSAASLTLAGRVDDPKTSLTVNGQTLALDPQGAFTLVLPLVEGANAVAFSATDLAGNTGRLDVAVVRDSQAPVVHFTNPDEGSVTNARQIQLSGQVDDLGASVQVDGQSMTLDATGFFTTSVDTTEGPMTFTATATDAAGNAGQATRSIQVDWTPPVITLDVPAPVLTAAPAHTFNGKVDDPLAAFTVNGQPVPLDAEGRFSLLAPLQEGFNVFRMEATDAAGNLGSLDVLILRDTVAPVVRLDAPEEGLLTNALQITAQGQVDDPTASVQVNGQAAPLDASGQFSLALSPAEGPLTLQAIATDLVGNTGQDTRHIRIDRTAPRIALTRAVPALYSSASMTLQGIVDDPAARLTFNGTVVPMDPMGAFQVEASLSEGPNAFHFEAADLAGNVGVLEVGTIRDSMPPVVTLETPQDGLVTNLRSLVVKGRVDDPTARLLVAGRNVGLGADGSFETTIAPQEGAQLIVALATDPAGNTGHAVRSVVVDWTPPALVWIAPTPAEGARVNLQPVAVEATVSESAAVRLNGQALTLESGAPFLAKTNLSPAEGPVALRLEATDAAGNSAWIERHFTLGLTAPKIVIDAPAEGMQTTAGSAVLTGRVECPDFLNPTILISNGTAVPVGVGGSFSLPVSLTEGANRFDLVATNAFGLQGRASRTLNRFTTPFGIDIEWPLDGLAVPAAQVEVRGRLLRSGTDVSVNGVPASVDPQTLRFTATVPLQPGLNTLTATGSDGAGNHGQAQVRVTSAPPADPSATYRWDLPVHGSASRTKLVHIQGQADLPGVTSVKVNGVPMALSGLGKDGRFEGDLPLDIRGRNVLHLEARTLVGATLDERREVSFVPDLPRIRLQAPEAARPGDVIPIQVSPEPGTTLKAAEVSWNGRFLAQVSDPFPAVSAQVPADAVVGSRILVEALATDAEGEQVTARTYVTVYGLGALLVEAYDDQKGLPLKEGQAAVEGGEAQVLDASGKAALRTALPQNWILVSRSGYTPVWRPAGLQVGGVQAVVDARLTPLAPGLRADMSPFNGRYGNGAFELAFPSGAFSSEGQVSATAISTQGLPGLLPAGWSAVSAWWLDLGALVLAAPGSAALALSPGAPQENLTWVHWNEQQHTWIALATGLRAADLASLPAAAPGGYALVVPDAGLTAPPSPVQNAQLPAFEGTGWREGLSATGTVDPAVLPTTAAIRGARATARFNLRFEGGDPVPSGALIQVDVLESYALLDSALIEPDGFTQDAVLARWILGVDDSGSPTLKAAQDLGFELPVRMSRTFQENELVDGRIWVGFYHDGVQVAQSGSQLLDASGGAVVRDGIVLTVPSQALTGTTLIRLNADQGDLAPLWPELAGKGTLAKSFQLDIVGNVQQGLRLRFEDLGQVPQGILPLLLQRRVVLGERVLVAVGELNAATGGWVLRTPEGGAPLLTGGSFAVLLPDQPWGWISGQVTVPGSVALPLVQRLGAKARLAPVRTASAGTKARPAAPSKAFVATAADDHAVADALVDAGYLKAVSAADGAFAVPAFLPPGAVSITVRGERRDLGVRGSLEAPVPSSGQALRLAQVPFQVLTVAPAEMAEVGVGTVVEILLSTAADPATLSQVKLYQETSAATPTPMASSVQGQAIPFSAAKAKKADAASQPGTKPGKKKAGAQPAKKAGKAAVSKSPKPARKNALQATEAPQLVEVAVRRILSQDGRTLLLTPETSLQPGALYRVATNGLASVSGEAAPAFTRRFKAQALPQFPDADLSRIKLSYPTDAFDVTVTIPEGAVPPWSIVEVEATDMGSYASGVMPPKGDLVFPIKANLGERLKVMVQLMDGRSLQGTISRYVAEDGRTTVSADGGRIEGPGGMSVVVPAGALDHPAEMQVLAPDHDPIVPDTALNPDESLLRGIRLRVKGDATFKKQPVLEIPASNLPGLTPQTGAPLGETELFNNGPLAIFQEQRRLLPDGSEDVFNVLVDTAQFNADGTKILSLGGLRLSDPSQGTVVQQLLLPASVKPISGSKARQASISSRPQGGETSFKALSSFGDIGEAISEWNWAVLNSMYYYHQGTVYRNWNGSGTCGGIASASCYGPLALAEIHRYRGTLGLEEARRGRLARGRMLATCDSQGRYVNVGGPMSGAIGGQRWIALFAVDPRTGETSIDPGSPSALDLGLHWERRDHSIAITSQGGNPFDPALTAPRIRAQVVDASGTARTMFTAGETATLRIFTESGSQSVVQGKVTGSLTQDFGTLPTEIPVTFSQEGSWKVDILGWTAKPVQGTTTASVIVTPVGQLGPSLPGKPAILNRDPAPGDQNVEPATVIKITFTEPVRGATATTFKLEVNGTEVPFRVISNAREVVDSSTLVQDVWLIPNQRLSLGGTVVVTLWSSVLVDQEGLSPDPATWSFTVRGADEVGSLTDVGAFTQMVVHKGKVYAVEDQGVAATLGGRRHAIRVLDISDPSNPRKGVAFGEHGIWEPKGAIYGGWASSWYPFFKHEVNGMRVAPGVAINGKSRDLLLVMSRAHQATELYSWDSEGNNEYRSRHNTLWAFDITDDADSQGSGGEPKLLTCSSLGTLSDTWGKGLGSAGGALGVIRLRGGLTMWSGDAWWNGFMEDAQAMEASGAAWNGVQVLTWRARYLPGYFPAPSTLVASNGFYNPTGARLAVMSGVISEDEDGRPVAYAAMGYSDGLLAFIDGKVGDPMSMATYTSGGPKGMDGRIQDLSFAVNGEYSSQVEVLKGTWQGPSGTEQGTLLLVGTQVGNAGRLWVLQPSKGAVGTMGAVQYAMADLPARITRIISDPAKMLVGVEAGGKAYIFDLKNLQPTSQGPMQITPILDFAVSGAWTVQNGFLYALEGSDTRKLDIRNIDGLIIEQAIGVPMRMDFSQVLAGTLMNYNNSVLQNPNAPVPVALDTGTRYAMRKLYEANGGTPWLRYYYPDLGEMNLSAFFEYRNPTTYASILKGGWFAEAKGELVGPNGYMGAVNVEGLKIIRQGTSDSQVGTGSSRCDVAADGDRALLELGYDPTNIESSAPKPENEWQRKFAYASFKASINPSLLAALDGQLRTDESESYKIRVRLKVYESQDHYVRGEAAAPEKTYEFTIKFNSNTRLFDVARGGVWYLDPAVSGGDPFNTGINPFTDEWAKFLLANRGVSEAELSDVFTRRLSMSVGEEVAKGSVVDGIKIQSPARSMALHDAGLDFIQGAMDMALAQLRRKVFQDGNSYQSLPMPMALRPSILQPMGETNLGLQAMSGDAPGAFGYRTTHAVNALQAFSPAEGGENGWRDLRNPDRWQTDPGIRPKELMMQGIAKIMPVISQRLKRSDGAYNPGNTLVHYLMAYPRLRSQGENDPNKGLFPINTMITRDLVFGATPDYQDPNVLAWAEKHAVDGRTHRQQREELDQVLSDINAMPGRSEAPFDETLVRSGFDKLLKALTTQEIIVDRTDPVNQGKGAYFNGAVGFLQLGLQSNWLKRLKDQGPEYLGYTPSASAANLHIMNDPVPTGPSWAGIVGSLFRTQEYSAAKARIADYLMKHLRARRVDIYINGIQNLSLDLEESAFQLQNKLLALEFPDPAQRVGKVDQVPVIAIYNRSSKLFYGGWDWKESALGILDIDDLLAQKMDTALPGEPTQNADVKRLMMTLQAVTEILCQDPTFEQAFLELHAREVGIEAAQLRLATLRNRITLHAHSQGAIVAAAAQSRLGVIQNPNSGQVRYTGDLVDLVTYGGGANMFDFLDERMLKSYRHHVNERDAVSALVGMKDPFQASVRKLLVTTREAKWYMTATLSPDLEGVAKGVLIWFSDQILKHPHSQRILKGSTQELMNAYLDFHKVIKFHSYCPGINFGEHNFVNGYLCHVGEGGTELPLWLQGLSNELDGGAYCLIPVPNDPRGSYPDCSH